MKPQVVILCGGMGTRIREETEFRPKPLVEVGGRPILWHIMKIYSHYGFNRFVLCLGYKGHMIKEHFLNYRYMNSNFTLHLSSTQEPTFYTDNQQERWTITFVDTGGDAMTGARVKKIEPYITGDAFMLTYGDGLADIDVSELWKYHKKQGRIGTVTGVRPVSRYGEISLRGDLVQAFTEKPQAQEGLISGGFFAFQRRFFDYLSRDDSCVLEKQPLERLTSEGQLAAYHHPGFWHCMDTYRDFVVLNETWEKGAPWKVWA